MTIWLVVLFSACLATEFVVEPSSEAPGLYPEW